MQLKNPSFYRKTFRIMIPIVLQQLITIGINFMDNLMIGKFGETSLSAAAFSNQFYGFFQLVCMGLGSGAVVMSSQYWGQKNKNAMRYVAALAFRFTIAVCLIFTVFTVACPDLVIRLYTNLPSVINAGIPYLQLIGLTIIMSGLASTSSYLMRSVGKIRISLIGSGIAFVLNIFFNWIFIFGKLGAPRLELLGAAVGTLIARAFECIFVFGYFILLDTDFGFRIKYIADREPEIAKLYIHYSIPVLISDTLLGLSLFLVSVIIGHIGEDIAAANAIVNSLVQIMSVINMAMAGASAVIIGNTIGSGDIKLAKSEGNSYIILSFFIGILIIPLLLLLENICLSVYSIKDNTRTLVRGMMAYNCIIMPLQTTAYVISKGILRGGGDTHFLLIADSSFVWFVSLPLGAISGLVLHLKPLITYILLNVEFPLKGILCFIRYKSGKWIKQVTQ